MYCIGTFTFPARTDDTNTPHLRFVHTYIDGILPRNKNIHGLTIISVFINQGTSNLCFFSFVIKTLSCFRLFSIDIMDEVLLTVRVNEALQNSHPMHYAASLGDLEVIKALIGRGFLVNCMNFELITPLHEAATKGQKAMCKFLLDEGAWVRLPASSTNIFNMLHYLSISR